MLIQDVKFDTKDDPNPQNSSQELPTSSKYECVLDVRLIMLGSWNWHTTQYSHIMVIFDVKFDTKDDPIL